MWGWDQPGIGDQRRAPPMPLKGLASSKIHPGEWSTLCERMIATQIRNIQTVFSWLTRIRADNFFFWYWFSTYTTQNARKKPGSFMGVIELHPSAVVYDHSYYPRGSRTSASPNRGHPHHCCYNLTRLKFWPLTWFQFRTARAPNRRDSTRITSWITTRIPSKLEGHQKSWKKNSNLVQAAGFRKKHRNTHCQALGRLGLLELRTLQAELCLDLAGLWIL